MTAFVVYNPRSAGGRTGRHWRDIQEALEGIFPLMEVTPTSGPGQAARLVRDALRDGHLDIIAVGGDGVINEALNGFFDHGVPVSPDAVFSFVSTGGALCQRFGIEPSAGAGILRLKQSRIRRMDVGRVSCLSHAGEPVTRYFLGTASFGLTASIARGVGRAGLSRLLGLAPGLQMLAAVLAWRPCRVRLMAAQGGGDPNGYDEIAGISDVALTSSGGSFDLAVTPGAPRLRLLRKLRNGLPQSRRRTARLTAAPTVETPRHVEVETDGESAGVLPATFDVWRNAINARF